MLPSPKIDGDPDVERAADEARGAMLALLAQLDSDPSLSADAADAAYLAVGRLAALARAALPR